MNVFNLLALIKNPKHSYWLLNLTKNSSEIFSSINNKIINDNILICLDVKETFKDLSLSPSPSIKTICLATVKKLLKSNYQEDIRWPQLSSADEAILWCKQAISTAFLQIEKLDIVNLCKIENRVIIPTITMENAGLPFDKIKWKKSLELIYQENKNINNQLKDLLPKEDGFLLFNNEDLNNDSYHHYQRAVSTINKENIDPKIALLIKKYQKNLRLITLYGEDFLSKINDRIFGHYNPLGTITGRFSCRDINLLGLPNYPFFQDCIQAKEGRQIIHFDYNAFEMRILAGLSNDKELINILSANKDIHSLVAKKIFKVNVSKTLNNHLRNQAKILNFGIIYGMSEKTLALKLNLSLTQAKELLEQYFAQFADIKNFLLSKEIEAKKLGYVNTVLNRKHYLEEFNHRIARNYPIQGSGADIIKLAINLVYNDLMAINASIINVIHDEIMVECDMKMIDEVSLIVKNGMSKAFSNIFSHIPISIGE